MVLLWFAHFETLTDRRLIFQSLKVIISQKDHLHDVRSGLKMIIVLSESPQNNCFANKYLESPHVVLSNPPLKG